MRQWVEKKVFARVAPILVQLWLRVPSSDVGKWTGATNAMLESANPMVKGAFWSFLSEAAETNPAKAKDEWSKLLKSGEVLDAAIVDTDNRNTDTKKAALRFLCSVTIFMAKAKDGNAKKHIKKVNALMEEDPKKKSAIEAERNNMRATMKKNATALKKANAPKKAKPTNKEEEKSPAAAAAAQPQPGAGGGGGQPQPQQQVIVGMANAASNEEA